MSRTRHDKPIIGYAVKRIAGKIETYWTGRTWTLHLSECHAYAKRATARKLAQRRLCVEREHERVANYPRSCKVVVKVIRRGDL